MGRCYGSGAWQPLPATEKTVLPRLQRSNTLDDRTSRPGAARVCRTPHSQARSLRHRPDLHAMRPRTPLAPTFTLAWKQRRLLVWMASPVRHPMVFRPLECQKDTSNPRIHDAGKLLKRRARAAPITSARARPCSHYHTCSLSSFKYEAHKELGTTASVQTSQGPPRSPHGKRRVRRSALHLRVASRVLFWHRRHTGHRDKTSSWASL